MNWCFAVLLFRSEDMVQAACHLLSSVPILSKLLTDGALTQEPDEDRSLQLSGLNSSEEGIPSPSHAGLHLPAAASFIRPTPHPMANTTWSYPICMPSLVLRHCTGTIMSRPARDAQHRSHRPLRATQPHRVLGGGPQANSLISKPWFSHM